MNTRTNVLRALLSASLALGVSPTAIAAEYFVSLSGKDINPGTIEAPFRSIKRGIAALVNPGDTLNLRHGVYVESDGVQIRKKNGAQGNPIVIRSYPGEHAYIDGSLSQFRKKNNVDWGRASIYDPDAHPDEFVSVATFIGSSPDRGAFLDRNPYTRLITYARLEDLRSDNHYFARIRDPADTREGPLVYEPCKPTDPNPPCAWTDAKGDRYRVLDTPEIPRHRRPWVYMGPGIWFDDQPDSLTAGKLHIRLSATHNSIPNLADYTGEVDPTKVALAITPEDANALLVSNSSHVTIRDLSVRYGGDVTVQLKDTTGVVFDHVRIFASTYGVRMGTSNQGVFSHTEFDGGTPTWYFRTDRKAEYFFLEGDTIVRNSVGVKTSRALLVGNPGNSNTEIFNSEFRSAHDLYLQGRGIRFHHNWINNLNDEGLFLDASDTDAIHVYQNVITRTLSPISFAGERPVSGHWFIYRNLVDVRAPVAGYRPQFEGDPAVWRHGNTFKSNGEDPAHAIFQNTFLVYAQKEHASYLHYENMNGNGQRRSLNNIFVAVNPDPLYDKPISYLPSPCFAAQADGNDYFRIGAATKHAFIYAPYSCVLDGEQLTNPTGKLRFDTLNAAYYASPFFNHSKHRYPPGYEDRGFEHDPLFLRIDPEGIPQTTDDLRLSDGSPARGTGAVLPDDLAALMSVLDPPPGNGRPDIGAYPFGSAPLRVGVDGRKSFPSVGQ